MEQQDLNKLELEQRTRTELDKFTQYDTVEKLSVGYRKFHIYYKDGLKCSKNLDSVDPYTMWLSQITCGHEYNYFPGQDESIKKFFRISKKQIDRAGFGDKEIAIHKLIANLVSDGWQHLQYPLKILKDDWDINCNEYVEGNRLILCPAALTKKSDGWYIQSSFYDYGNDGDRSYIEAWKNPSFLYNMIVKLINYNRDVTMTNLIQVMNSTHLSYKNRVGLKFRPPGFYWALFKMLNIQSVHDMHPINLAKAIAASKANVIYSCEEADNVLHKQYNDFTKIMGNNGTITKCNWSDVKPDVLLLDNNLECEEDVSPYLPLLGTRFKMIIAFRKEDGDIPISYFNKQEPSMFLKIYQ